MRSLHIYFDGQGSRELAREIIGELYPGQNMDGVEFGLFHCPWPEDVEVFAVTRIAVERKVGPEDVQQFIREHDIHTRTGNAHGQRFLIITIDLAKEPVVSEPPKVELTPREKAQAKVCWPAIGLMTAAVAGFIFALLQLILSLLNSSIPLLAVPALVLQPLVFCGAYQMMLLKGRPLAMAACLISVIPFLSSVIVLGIPLGIWGLVVLNNRAVSAEFS